MLKEKFTEWTTAYVNDLPDSCFAYISDGGKKDSDGKTTPRSLRHLPYKDKDGKVDLPHVRNALARLESTQIPASAKPGIKKKLEAILEKAKAGEVFVGVFPFEFDEDADAAEDATVAIPSAIHLIPIGQWDHDAYGPILITASDIREFAQNFNMKIRKGVPITAGHEGYQELPAQGWITSVEARDNGLWGEVEWNDLGKETLSDKQYKFFSPEFYRDYEDPESHQIYRNVLTGGALTKSPYFKELEAVIFSDKAAIKKLTHNEKNMTVEELLALDKASLTDEQKAFLKEHAAELTDEQKADYKDIVGETVAPAETPEEKAAREEKEKGDANEAAGLNRDGTEKVTASEKGKMIQMSETEVKLLREKADKGAEAFAELEKAKLDTAIKGLTFSESNKTGKFLPKSADKLRAFMQKLNAEQRLAFSALVAEIPTAKIFSEIGAAGASEGTAKAEVEAKITAKIEASEKAGKPMKYSDALREVMSENEGLEERYDAELTPVRAKA